MTPTLVRPLPILPPLKDCTLCPLHTIAKSVGISLHYLPFSLPPSPTTPILLIIGQNPGYHEDQSGTPFIGKSGHILQLAYIRAHSLHTLATIYITNICRCFHRDGPDPTNSHYKACRPHLLTDLAHLDGRGRSLTILTLGAPATTHTYALLGRPRVTLTSSFSHQGATLPCPLPPTPSPSNPSSPATAAATSSATPPASPTSPTDPPTPPPTTPGTSADPAPTAPRSSLQTSATKKPTRTKTPPASSLPSTTTTPSTTNLTIFSSFHPAAVDRSNNLIHAVSGHLTLLRAHLTNSMPIPSTPLILSPIGPP